MKMKLNSEFSRAGVEELDTRASLLSRIKDVSADRSWSDFFELYWKLIYDTARKYGLTRVEAQEVVQETMLSVSKSIPDFKYDPKKGSFKEWLKSLTYWRIMDALRRRKPFDSIETIQGFEEVEGPAHFAEIWEEDWQCKMLATATERVKGRFHPGTFQIYTVAVTQKRGVKDTADLLNITRAKVYLTNHRITKAITREIKILMEEQSRNH